jgi:hypothetical protein
VSATEAVAMTFHNFSKPLRYRILGFTIVLISIFGLISYWGWSHSKRLRPVSWVYYFLSPHETHQVFLKDSQSFAIGDPVFLQGDNLELQFAGEVTSIVSQSPEGSLASIRWRATGTPPANPEVVYYETPKSLVWVAQTLLPPEKRKIVIQKLFDYYQRESPKLGERITPIVQEVFTSSLPLIEKSAIEYLRSDEERLAKIGARYQDTLVQKKLIPLIKHEVMPIVERHAEPVVEEIGSELWNRASLWRFGWRYAYDSLPLTNRGLVQQEWRRFVDQEAIPVFEEHLDEIIEVQKKIVIDTVSNPAVRNAAQESLGMLIEDAELRTVLSDCLHHAILDNKELQNALRTALKSKQAEALAEQFEASFQPLADEIGVELFGSQESGLTPELVAVLRSQILGKDQRWIVVRKRDLKRPSGQIQPSESSDNLTLPSGTWQAVRAQDVARFPFQVADLKMQR